MGDIPPLGGLSVNTPPGRQPPPPPTTVRDLPRELTDEVLASYLAKLDVDELCEANLLQICMLLRGTNQCNDPDDPLWKAACARFGLTERIVGGTPDAPATPTWHVTFLAMCKEVATLEPDDRATYKRLLRGQDAYTTVTLWTPPPRSLSAWVVQLWNHAAFGGLLCVMHYLLRRVDGIVHDGNDSALRTASANGRADVVEVLLAHGADVNALNFVGYARRTALLDASTNGHLAVVEVLLAHGANVNDDHGVALRSASLGGHLAVVEVLLAHGADVHAYNDRALRNASAMGRVAVVEVLLAHGANVHADNDEALRSASENGHPAVVEVLLAHGADVHGGDLWGRSAIVYASANGHTAVVEALLAHGADVHASDDAALKNASKHGHTAVVELLRAAGATE